MRIFICLAMVVLIAGCSSGTVFSEDPAPGRPSVDADGEMIVGAPKITRVQAVDIALKRVQTEPFADDIDATRMIVYYGKFGPAGQAQIRWVVDFAWRGSSEITPGQWARGYWVVVDTESGAIVEALGYER